MAKIKPSERNRKNAEILKAKQDIETWKKAMGKFKEATPPFNKCRREMEKAQYRLDALQDAGV